MTVFKHLFKPINIGRMVSKNRLLMSAMSINFGVDENGFVNDQLIEYFIARAKGGVGMMLVGGGAVHPTGLELPELPKLWSDDCIPPLSKMVESVKPYGTKFGVQLMHGGRQSYHDHKVAPSPIPAPAVVKGIPKELSIGEIEELVEAFGDSALRCMTAGFDFIEIHGAHGYLINQFLSPNSNHRTDKYGGSFENRFRFLKQIIRNIKLKVDPEFPVGIRINGEDYIENGIRLSDALTLSRLLEDEGVDYLHISAGVYGSSQLTIPSMYVKHGCFVHLADAVKKIVSVPVICVGRIKTAELADRIIGEGKADAVSMGRALLADPELPEKSERGDISQIRPCIGCCLGCIHAVLALEPGGCVVNPEVSREYLLKDIEQASHLKKILIIGAGPSGLASARSAAMRGHKVVLCEETAHLGGLIRLAAKPPGRNEISEIIEWYIGELERLKVSIRLNTSLDSDLIKRIHPDEIILSTGSLPEMPIIRGLFKSSLNLCMVTDVLAGKSPTGRHVIILGGGQAGLVLADYLAELGKTVAVLNRKRHFGEEMSSNDRFYVRERLKRKNVTLYKRVSAISFKSDSVTFKCQGETKTLAKYDTVVISENMAPIREAKNQIKSDDIPVHIIGDAKKPRNLMLCLAEAEELGRTL